MNDISNGEFLLILAGTIALWIGVHDAIYTVAKRFGINYRSYPKRSW